MDAKDREGGRVRLREPSDGVDGAEQETRDRDAERKPGPDDRPGVAVPSVEGLARVANSLDQHGGVDGPGWSYDSPSGPPNPLPIAPGGGAIGYVWYMEPLRWERKPKLRKPTMVCAFAGWNDAAGS